MSLLLALLYLQVSFLNIFLFSQSPAHKNLFILKLFSQNFFIAAPTLPRILLNGPSILHLQPPTFFCPLLLSFSLLTTETPILLFSTLPAYPKSPTFQNLSPKNPHEIFSIPESHSPISPITTSFLPPTLTIIYSYYPPNLITPLTIFINFLVTTATFISITHALTLAFTHPFTSLKISLFLPLDPNTSISTLPAIFLVLRVFFAELICFFLFFY